MQGRLNQLLERIDGLQPRERLIVFVAGLGLILLAWFLMLGESEMNRHARLLSERAGVELQLADLDARLVQHAQQQEAAANPRQRLAELERRTAHVDGKIRDYATELISPTEMARLLERVLERREVLTLRRLRNLGAEDLLPQDSPGENRLYRHGLVLELEGPYLAVLAYLDDLEALPWRLYWQTLEIDAGDYPVNRVLIEVATLSLHEEWIGV